MRDEESEGRVYSTSPSALTEVNLDFKFQRLKVAVDDVSGSGVKIDFGIEYSFTWTDERMATSPCRKVVDTMLSSKGSIESQHKQNYWRPVLGIKAGDEPARRQELLDSTYSLNGSVATLKLSEAVTIPQGFDYQFFPFDQHSIRIDLQVPSVNLFGCKALIDRLRAAETTAESANLLPESGTWLWRTCGTAGGGCTAEAIAMDLMIDPEQMDGDDAQLAAIGMCPIILNVRRSNIVFIVKHLIPLVMIAEAPLLAMWLNPTIPPFVGSRITISIIAMLLVMSKSAQDLGLGILTGIIWTDEFALVQFFMILSGLLETIFVVTLIRLDKTVLGLAIDGVFRKMLPFALYPCLVLGWIFKGLDDLVMFFIATVGGMLFFTALGTFYTWRNFQNTKKLRAKVIKELRELNLGDRESAADLDDEKTTLVMKRAFDTFDLDKSRKLEKREVRLILDAMYPNLTRKQALKAMSAVKEDEIPFEDFAECVEAWNDIKHEPPPPRKRVTLLERLGFRKKLKKGFKEVRQQNKVINAFATAKNLPKPEGRCGGLLAAAAAAKNEGSAPPAGAAGAFAGAFAKIGQASDAPAAAPPAANPFSAAFSKLGQGGSKDDDAGNPPPARASTAASMEA